jgi:hypothetical protein
MEQDDDGNHCCPEDLPDILPRKCKKPRDEKGKELPPDPMDPRSLEQYWNELVNALGNAVLQVADGLSLGMSLKYKSVAAAARNLQTLQRAKRLADKARRAGQDPRRIINRTTKGERAVKNVLSRIKSAQDAAE